MTIISPSVGKAHRIEARMKKAKKEEIEDFAEVSERNYRPVEEDPTEKMLKIVCNGAAVGVLAGLVVAQLPGNENFLFGYFLQDGGLAILGYAGTGLVIGALGGWLYAKLRPQNAPKRGTNM
jgi:hypothetical protein